MKNEENKVYKNRWIMLYILLVATFMSTLDSSIVNVALPDMAQKLNVSMAAIEWVVTSFLITIAAFILIFGRLGDIKGKIKIFKFGVVLFTLGSFLCGFTNSLLVLVLARVLQAIGAAATMATNQGIVTQVFPAKERGRALGVIGTFVALGAMAGPPLGGFIVSIASWKYIFLVNVPIGIIVSILMVKIFPKIDSVNDEKLDGKGALLFTVSIVLLFGAIVQGQNTGYNNIYMIAAFVISIIAFIAFIYVEKRTEMPLLQLKIFNNSLFSISIVCALTSFIAISASNIILPFYFEDALKMPPAQAGLFMMISPVTLAIVAPISGYLSDKIGSELLTLIGLILTTIGLSLISTLTEKSIFAVLALFLVIMTLGNGIFQSPNNSLVMSTVSRDKLGIAGSVNSLIRNLGMVIGTSFATLILYDRMSSKMGYRVVNYVNGRPDVFIYGMSFVYILAAVICGIGAVITAIRLFGSKKKQVSKSLENNIS